MTEFDGFVSPAAIDEQSAMEKNGPSLLICQTNNPDGDLSRGSLFRLGAYTGSAAGRNEASLVTNLSTTTTYSPVLNHYDLNPITFLPEMTEQIGCQVTTIQKSKNDGILIYTDSDLQENISGLSLSKFGRGHSIEVSDNDAYYNVKNGKYEIYAKSGINISSGTLNTSPEERYIPADIVITSLGKVKIVSSGDSEHTTDGNHVHVTNGNSESETNGHTIQNYYGTKTTTVYGAVVNNYVARVSTLSLSFNHSVTLSGDISLRAGPKISVTLVLDLAISVGRKIDVNKGGEIKITKGGSRNFTLGPEFKQVNSNLKTVLGKNYKQVCGEDAKSVIRSGAEIKEFKWEQCPLEHKKNEIASIQADIVNKSIANIKSENCSGFSNLFVKFFSVT